MNNLTSNLEKQKKILESHKPSEDSLLKKQIWKTGYGMEGFDKPFTGCELTGLVNYEKHKFLPHFEYTVGTTCSIKLPPWSISEMIDDYGLTTIKLKIDNKTVRGVFKKNTDLFVYRNTAKDGRTPLNEIISPLEVETDNNQFSFEYEIDSYFYFRASSTSHGQLVGRMKIDHPNAENVIERFLATIDEKFEKYRGLEKYFKEKDENGEKLYEDENLQSKTYNDLRRKLHKEMFESLEAVLRKENLKYSGFYHSKTDVLKSFIKQLIF